MSITKKSMVVGGAAITLMGGAAGVVAMPSVAGADAVNVGYNYSSNPGVGIWSNNISPGTEWKAGAFNNTSSPTTGSLWLDFYNGSGIESWSTASETMGPGQPFSTPYIPVPSDAQAAAAYWKVNGTVVAQWSIALY